MGLITGIIGEFGLKNNVKRDDAVAFGILYASPGLFVNYNCVSYAIQDME